MTSRDLETIFALASGRPPAATAVVRISGTKVPELARALLGTAALEPRRMSLRTIRNPATGAPIDQGLALSFAAPASFTGEDVLELHVHGGRAIIGSLFDTLSAFPGVRHAEAGEFTRRALLNGKLDLTGAEAVADLVAADTRAQLGQALRQLSGALADACERWRSALLRALAHVETELDFPDEDVDPMTGPRVGAAMRALADEIRRALDDGHAGERIRDGVRIAIIGRPNVGKSSLLNRLAARDVAIVSEIAGTTRDLIETHIDVGGVPVVLVDTAGLRESDDPIEREGRRRAESAAAAADHRIFLTAWPDPEAPAEGMAFDPTRDLQVVNKADLATGVFAVGEGIAISAKTGDGVDGLIARLGELVAGGSGGDAPIVTRARHREALSQTLQHLDSAIAAIDGGYRAPELWAEDLRLAARALGRITGRVDVEDVLDIVFAEFCIGK